MIRIAILSLQHASSLRKGKNKLYITLISLWKSAIICSNICCSSFNVRPFAACSKSFQPDILVVLCLVSASARARIEFGRPAPTYKTPHQAQMSTCCKFHFQVVCEIYEPTSPFAIRIKSINMNQMIYYRNQYYSCILYYTTLIARRYYVRFMPQKKF